MSKFEGVDKPAFLDTKVAVSVVPSSKADGIIVDFFPLL